jgi:hypothetical protein
MTQPTADTTVSNTAWATLWLEGSTAATKTYSLTLGGKAVGSTTTASNGPVSIAYNTKLVTDGTQPLTATVTDSANKSGSTSTNVIVKNGITASPAPAPTPTPTPTPTPPPPTGTLKVSITGLANGATVRGTVWPVLWVEGQSGTSNTFTLSAGGKVIASQVTSSRGPVALPWTTTSGPNGNTTLTATVKDATGKTGATSINVTVGN